MRTREGVVLIVLALVTGFAPVRVRGQASNESWYCAVSRKLDTEKVYSAEDVSRGQFSVRIVQSGADVTLERCSFAPSQNAVTCDSYPVDRVERDPNIGVIKYYVFRSQFDVQVFADGIFIENNGRGGIAFGHCSLTN